MSRAARTAVEPEASTSPAAATPAARRHVRPRQYTADEVTERESEAQRGTTQAVELTVKVKPPSTRWEEREVAQRARRRRETIRKPENKWSAAVARLNDLVHLHISSAYFSLEIAHELGVYVEHATVLNALFLADIKVADRDAATFLRFVSRNRSLKQLSVEGAFLTARQGRALAYVVLKNVTLQRLQVKGSLALSPSVLLKAAVQSRTLTSLSVHECLIRADDIYDMATALTPHSTPLARDVGDTPVKASCVNSLKKLEFRGCMGADPHLNTAYADLIRGK
ncbi:hypothetical protein MTO96_032792 [Rhipicephalus appendiculatus]